jgi:ubiquinone/menaquinone biosynthesis C-methylase UbiE
VKDPRQRFTGRTGNYVKYRTGYPPSLIAVLGECCGLTPESVVADIGSGTGTLTKMLLDNGNRVYAVEPNSEMRAAAERILAGYAGFVSVDAAAEAVTLPDGCVDLVTVARALQWFDAPTALDEMARILRPRGRAAVIWNRRRNEATPMLAAYNWLLQTYCDDYAALSGRRESAIAMLESRGFSRKEIPMPQQFDLEQFAGLIGSLSVAPDESHPNHAPMMRALATIFEANQRNGVVTMDYTTTVYYGRPQS